MFRLSAAPSCIKLLTYCLTLLFFFLLFVFLFKNLQHHYPSSSVSFKYSHSIRSTPVSLHDQTNQPNSLSKFVKSATVSRSLRWKSSCRFHSCFNISRCTLNTEDKILVYVYPQMHYKFTVSLNQSAKQTIIYEPYMSREYEEAINTVINSPYYVPAASEACVFLPSLDILNQRTVNTSLHSAILQTLPHWHYGENHIIFSMLAGSYPEFNSTPDVLYERAMIAGGSLHSTTYRRGFDIAIPVYNSLTHASTFKYTALNSNRHTYLTVVVQPGSDSVMVSALTKLATEKKGAGQKIRVLSSCFEYPSSQMRCSVDEKATKHVYPDILQDSVFCLLVPGFRLGTPDLLDAMMTGCIPVLIKSGHVLPFSEVLDWSRAAVMVWEEQIPALMSVLDDFSNRVQEQMRNHVAYLYWRFFSSISSIVLTTLDILNIRVYPLSSYNTYEWWNNQPFDPSNTRHFQYSYPYGLDLPSSPSQGFTAVIYSTSHNNIHQLFNTIQNVAKAPSATKIIVIWCSAESPPPPGLVELTQPSTNKPVHVISVHENKQSNRFYPYKEIQTAGILSLDDDVSSLSVDEIEFGFKAWQENPKQLIGYSGSTHWYNRDTERWHYSNQCATNVSMVLIGAAFYHSFYNILYTHHLTPRVRQYVDEHVVCGDIGFNFMLSNFTGLPPIKVTPRKSFPCKSCQHSAPRSSSTQYRQERDACLQHLTALFNTMPLKTLSYKLNPVLYNVDEVKDQYKLYTKMGEL